MGILASPARRLMNRLSSQDVNVVVGQVFNLPELDFTGTDLQSAIPLAQRSPSDADWKPAPRKPHSK